MTFRRLRNTLVFFGLSLWLVACAGERTSELCLTLLDVGQGDSILLELPQGEVWLVDGGGFAGGDGRVGRRVLLPELRRRGIDRIDRLLISHADSDHYEGLFALQGNVDITEVWLPTRSAGPRFRRLITLLERAGSRLVVLDEGPPSFTGPSDVEVRLLHPSSAWVDGGGEERGKNNNSLVFSISMGQVDFLLTGDLEEEGEQWLLESGAFEEHEVLKVGHHGSNSSSSAPFLDRVSPLVSLVGTGRDNRYGFPHASVRRRILRRGSALLWSARHGTVRTCTDGWALRAEQLADGRVVAELGSWTPQQILRRNRTLDSRRREAIPQARIGDLRRKSASVRAKKRSSSRRRDQGKGKKRSRRSRAASERSQSDDPVSPKLIDERTWQRRRKSRNRFRPGW